MKTQKKIAPLIAAVLAASTGAIADTVTEPTYEQLRQQIAELQQRLDQIETTRVNAADTDRVVAEVLNDAHRRSQLLAVEGLTAGYNRGFFIRSADGSFQLKPSLAVQFRYVANLTGGENSDGQDGFEIRRLRPRIDGNVFSPNLTYSFQWDVARNGGNVTLLDAWAQYKFGEDWAIRIGQFKESVFHERDIGFTRQLAADRSILDSIAGNETDRVQGVALLYGGGKEDSLRAEVAFHDGANSKNTDFRNNSSHFGVGGRVEYRVSGNWADYRDFTAKGTTTDLLVVGAGADFTQTGDTDVIRSVIDVQWEYASGLGVFGAVYGRFTNSDDNRTDYGASVQVGYLLNPSWEVFGRYSVLRFDDVGGDDRTVHEIVGGVTRYLGPNGSYKHSAKATVDVVYLPNGFPTDQTGSGILAGDGDEVVLRAQFILSL